MGDRYPAGLLVMMSNRGAFHYYDWRDVQRAIVLSGGGARGAAHIGVLRYLEEQRVQVDFVVGAGLFVRVDFQIFGAKVAIGLFFFLGRLVALDRCTLQTNLRLAQLVDRCRMSLLLE